MILDRTNKKIEILLGGAVTTNQLPVTVAYVDYSGSISSPFLYASSDTQTNNTTAVTIVGPPTTGHQRQLKSIHIHNADTANTTVTVRLNNNETLRKIVQAVLQPNESLVYESSLGWIRLPRTFENRDYPDGTAAAPSITFEADTDTGLYRIGANILGFATGGVERLQINSTGLLTATAGLTLAGPILFSTDNAQDIGASGASRPRTGYFGTSLNVPAGTATAPSVQVGSNDLGLYRVTTNVLGIATGGVERVRIDVNAFQITQNIRPGTDNAIDSSESGLRWRDGFFGTSVRIGTNPATTGALRLANAGTVYARNNAATADHLLIHLDAADRVELAGDNLSDILWGKPLVALGGGATPTLGTIGGSGPSTAAQNTWMRVVDSAGAAFWVAVWK